MASEANEAGGCGRRRGRASDSRVTCCLAGALAACSLGQPCTCTTLHLHASNHAPSPLNKHHQSQIMNLCKDPTAAFRLAAGASAVTLIPTHPPSKPCASPVFAVQKSAVEASIQQ